ncbi:helix-turn-helix domain-containing protein [Bacillus sp. CH126_4D]|uniref:helix-turn-helix domain-containing protein n=1 Tax=Bacillus TaxID=1386 RepID=UPI000B4337AD|nr:MULTISPECIES: helix-turn-helix transcriptional regulator [Bacillus]OUB51203.1 transcriptional regulator [Bacillus thuringiensis serovar argentinensis]KAB2429207.1 helix-turn-helix domain-containing protein [Bacillus cereus]KAB2460893.1 helix-turn-helix domain-containing protein [Bacillus sp. CH140a_4T]KAB2474975.1 helix-turn-helix domain-containing protein [Bacillus sp. CH126_4D]MCU5149449.1 helix-turn-helix domain-containing protein [Bacillus cereus]
MFGQRLRELRNKKNISATALGKTLGIAQTTISNWENSGYEPSYEMLVKISRYFGVSVDYLVGNDNDVNKNEISRLAKELYEDLDDLPEDERNDIEKGLLEYLEFLGYKLKKTKK